MFFHRIYGDAFVEHAKASPPATEMCLVKPGSAHFDFNLVAVRSQIDAHNIDNTTANY